jgi:hypothetical protein
MVRINKDYLQFITLGQLADKSSIVWNVRANHRGQIWNQLRNFETGRTRFVDQTLQANIDGVRDNSAKKYESGIFNGSARPIRCVGRSQLLGTTLGTQYRHFVRATKRARGETRVLTSRILRHLASASNFERDEQLAPSFRASKLGPCSLSPILLVPTLSTRTRSSI